MNDDTPPHGIDRPDILGHDLARIRALLHADADIEGLDEHADLWHRLNTAAAELAVIVHDLTQQVGAMLADTGYDPKDGYRLPDGTIISHYQPAVKERWQGRRLLRALSTSMIDPDTGETVESIPLRVLVDIIPGVADETAVSSKWRTTGLKNLDVDPDDYRTREWGEPRVKIGPRR